MVHESRISVLIDNETDPRVFELEMWMRGLSSFLEIRNLPMSSYEREHASIHNYRPELACVRSGLEKLLVTINHLLGEDRIHFSQFVVYLDHIRTDKSESHTSVEGLLAEVIVHIQDLIRVAVDLSTVTYVSLQTYHSFGRLVHSLLHHHPAMSKLLEGAAIPRLSDVSKDFLLPLLKETKHTPYGNSMLAIIMVKFKILHFIQYIMEILNAARNYPAAVLLFSLIHDTWEQLEGQVNSRYLQGIDDESLKDLLESMVFSSRMELRKVMEMELVDVNLYLDPQIIHGKLEDSVGICRDLFQQNIISILQRVTEKEIEGESVFPYYQNRREQSVRLVESLTELQEKAFLFTEEGSRPAFGKFMDRFNEFHSTCMKYLMYKDWGAVDRFYYDLKSIESLKQREFLAHQFDVYLRTLIAEVRKRSVLQR